MPFSRKGRCAPENGIEDLLFHREGADVDHVCVRIVLQIANPHLRESVARIRQLKRLPDAHFLQRIVADRIGRIDKERREARKADYLHFGRRPESALHFVPELSEPSFDPGDLRLCPVFRAKEPAELAKLRDRGFGFAFSALGPVVFKEKNRRNALQLREKILLRGSDQNEVGLQFRDPLEIGLSSRPHVDDPVGERGLPHPFGPGRDVCGAGRADPETHEVLKDVPLERHDALRNLREFMNAAGVADGDYFLFAGKSRGKRNSREGKRGRAERGFHHPAAPEIEGRRHSHTTATCRGSLWSAA